MLMLRSMSLLISILLISGLVQAQSSLEITLSESKKLEKEQMECIHLMVRSSTDDQLQLSSQNYRMYYNSDNLSLDDVNIKMMLPEDKYQMKLVQHVPGVDATGIGNLEFENNLGFINISVVHSNIALPGVAINKQNLPIAEMCFKVKNWGQPKSVILAREDLTAAYGRAYIEISSLDAQKVFIPMKIVSYKDFVLQ